MLEEVDPASLELERLGTKFAEFEGALRNSLRAAVRPVLLRVQLWESMVVPDKLLALSALCRAEELASGVVG